MPAIMAGQPGHGGAHAGGPQQSETRGEHGMITIDALGKDGASILPDLDGASPTGGFAGTHWRTQYKLAPGDVVRFGGAWAVIAGITHNGLSGMSTVAVIDAGNKVHRHALSSGDGMEARTDARIDPVTLWKLAKLGLTPAGPDACPGNVPAAVVVDTRDAYTFAKDGDGRPFSAETASAFACVRNAEMKPEHRTYRVFALTPA